MSFLFSKKNKTSTGSELPIATRNISSSHGPETRIPTANGVGRPGEVIDRRPQMQGSNGGGSLSSLQGDSMLPGPDPKMMAVTRQRAESDLGGGARSGGPPDSLYPWSMRRMKFANNLSPFPRYGAAANAMASKEGQVYLMGGLVDSQTVKGDLWMVEVANGSMACYPVNTTSEGPGPRVGHSSLLVGNAFIVFGGDTKLEEGDVLDDTLYLLNISTKQWSRASPAGPRPTGRYGHTLNILGSKIFIFGGQVEGYFFNDLIAFDLNSLQTPGNRWEVLIPNGGTGVPIPKARTNHSVVTWQDKLYLFGGTDGTQWFNDVWTYDARTNQWSELDCIGYIPAPREGHAAALVNDTMYIFGGRLQDGTDLGDLAAFRISSRRWYMFQNMGSSPSARSGHSMTAVGKHIVVLAGEPSSAPRDATELSNAYVLDTTKIRYPQTETGPNPQTVTGPGGGLPLRKFSNDQSRLPQKTAVPMAANHSFSRPSDRSIQPPLDRATEPSPQNGPPGPHGPPNGPPPQSRLPRNASSGPPPPQAAPQPRGPPGALPGPPGSRSRTPTKNAQSDIGRTQMYDRENTVSPQAREPLQEPTSPRSIDRSMIGGPVGNVHNNNVFAQPPSRQGPPSRSGSRNQRQQASVDSLGGQSTPRQSEELSRTSTKDTAGQFDSGLGSSPSLGQHDELIKELEAARSRNAWLASELALARKSGYNTTTSSSPLLDQKAADVFDDDDRPLIEALLEMKAELSRVQGAIETQADSTASRIAEIETQRDAAINEAVYAKAKLAAHGGSQAGTPQPDARGMSTPDLDRNNDMGRRLANLLTAHNDATGRLDTLTAELEAERRARSVMEESAEANHKRAAELDLYKQRASSELETLRAELHEAKRIARDESTKSAEALASLRMHELDKNDFQNKHAKAVSETKSHAAILHTLREAVTASTEKADLLERRIAEERELRELVEQKHAQLKSEHETSIGELASTARRLQETEELAQRHADEARTHKAAVLSGLDRVSAQSFEDDDINDERVTLLQQQLEIANDMARQHKTAADTAADRLRRAEERIAGLEQYQEQTTRESLSLRKQLQNAVKEVQAAHTERTTMQQQVERHQLEGNALEVQLRTLKNLLEERGVSTADVRRSRILDSPSSRFGTPEMSRFRELERQLDESAKTHDEMRTTFEQREHDLNREWEEKLSTFEKDQEGAMKYVRGLEKMLAKMKQELQKTKAVNAELEKGLKDKAGLSHEAEQWASERESLRKEMGEQQKSVHITMSALEAQIATLKTALGHAEQDRDVLKRQAIESQAQHESRMNQLAERANMELDALRRANLELEVRADEAEKKVQLFLDQFENSVDNYRRQSRQVEQNTRGPNGIGASTARHGHKESNGGESIYSNMTDTTETDVESANSGDLTPSAHSFPTAGFAGGVASNSTDKDKSATTTSGHGRDRSSTALDSLATELDALRSHWEETNKKNNYRLSDRFEFEKHNSPGTGLGFSSPNTGSSHEPGPGSAGLADWRKKMDLSIRSNEDRDTGKEKQGPSSSSTKGSLAVGSS